MKSFREQNQNETYLPGELYEADERAFEAHFRQCADCSRPMTESGGGVISMDSADDHQALESCFSAVQQEIRAAGISQSKPPHRGKRRVLLRIAAALAVVLGVGFWLARHLDSPEDLQLVVKWQQDGNLITTNNDRPVVRNGKVFTLHGADGVNQLVALAKADGSVVWQTPIGQTTRIVADQYRIYTGQYSAGIFSISALSVENGEEEWACDYAFDGKPPRNVSFQLMNGRLNWIADRTLYSFDTEHGTLVWKTKLNEHEESYAMPVFHDGTLRVVGSQKLYTLDHSTGLIIGERPHDEQYTHYLNPKVSMADDRIFVAATTAKGKGRVICYDKQNGRQLWIRETDRVKNIQSAQGLVIVKNQRLEAYRQSDGGLVWSEPIGGCYKVAFHNNNIFAIRSTGKHDIVALNTQTGKRIKSFSISGQSCSGILIDGRDGFVTTNEGRLIAMRF